MRTLLLISLVLFASSNLQAQKNSRLTMAEIHYDNQELEEAKEDIDLAFQQKNLVKKAKAWLLKGKIYYALATKVGTPTSSEGKLTYFQVAVKAFERAKLTDNKVLHTTEIWRNQKMMNAVFLNEGVFNFNGKDYANALSFFDLSQQTAKSLGFTDSLAIYNSGLTLEKMDRYDDAIKMYKQCAEMDYRGAKIYTIIQYLYTKTDHPEMAKASLAEGRGKYPKNVQLLTTELNNNLKDGNFERAFQLINESIALDPSNAELYFTRASLKESMEKPGSDIVSDYEKALTFNSEHCDAQYSIGAYYYKVGSNLLRESTITDDYEESSNISKLAKIEYRKSLSAFEKALELKPKERKVIEALKTLYSQLEMTEEYERMKEKLSN